VTLTNFHQKEGKTEGRSSIGIKRLRRCQRRTVCAPDWRQGWRLFQAFSARYLSNSTQQRLQWRDNRRNAGERQL